MATRLHVWAFILVSTVLVSVAHGQTCKVVDRQALEYFQLEIVYGGEEFTTWKDGTNCCAWEGVICNADGHVESLNIVARNEPHARPTGERYLVGAALGDLVALKNLTMLNVAYNGQVPPSWGGLKKLEELDLEGCNVVGTIPQELCQLSNLNTLILKRNFLSGSVPDCIQNLALTSLDLTGNQLSGPVTSIP